MYFNYILMFNSLSEPTSPDNIMFSLVDARSLIVSWDEVPCSGQNGPITRCILYYTNMTFSDTITITGPIIIIYNYIVSY